MSFMSRKSLLKLKALAECQSLFCADNFCEFCPFVKYDEENNSTCLLTMVMDEVRVDEEQERLMND